MSVYDLWNLKIGNKTESQSANVKNHKISYHRMSLGENCVGVVNWKSHRPLIKKLVNSAFYEHCEKLSSCHKVQFLFTRWQKIFIYKNFRLRCLSGGM